MQRLTPAVAGKKSNSRQFDSYGAPYGQNDVIGCLLDLDRSVISFTKNGQDLGVAFQLPGQLREKALYPAICLKNAELVVNFGKDNFQHDPPQGFVGLAKAPQEWVSSGSASVSSLQLPSGSLQVSCMHGALAQEHEQKPHSAFMACNHVSSCAT